MKNATTKDLNNVITHNPVDSNYATDLSEIRKNSLPAPTYMVRNEKTGQRCDFSTLPAAVLHYFKLPGNVGDWIILHSDGSSLDGIDQSMALSSLEALVAYSHK